MGFYAGKPNDHPDNPFKSVQSYDHHKAHKGKQRFVFSLVFFVFFVVSAFVEVATDLYKKKDSYESFFIQSSSNDFERANGGKYVGLVQYLNYFNNHGQNKSHTHRHDPDIQQFAQLF